MAHTPTPDIQQQRLTMLTQKLAKLYEQYDLETDAARQFQLEHLIKETEAEIQGIPPSPALPPQGGQGAKTPAREGMSDTMKAGLIGAAAVLLGALITVAFSNSGDTNVVTGNCNTVVTGTTSGAIDQCTKEEAKHGQ